MAPESSVPAPFPSPPWLIEQLRQMLTIPTIQQVRQQAQVLSDSLQAISIQSDDGVPTNGVGEQDGAKEQTQAYLCAALHQIAQTRTLERARYYMRRLIRGLTEIRTSPINDINLNCWKAYEHIWTDSLWIVERRDRSGAHHAGYWGNFIPQIPRQMMLRYTKQGEWVLDPFAGSGTTLIEGQRLGRNTIGIELQPSAAELARTSVAKEPNPQGVCCEIIVADCTRLDYSSVLQRHGQQRVQLVILHPPYHDIIIFSDHPDDLSNAPSLDDFLARMGMVIERVAVVLDRGRMLVLVIGDKYTEGEWIPLGFLTMQEILRRGFLLKSIVVKNFGEGETTGKRYQKALWRYRALAGGFYVFKHEYLFVFEKVS